MKKDIDAKCYELTLTPNYVSDWTFNDALRELIQNGTDQEVLDKENKFQIIYNEKEKTLRLVNQKSVLKINTLLLGRSSKANNEDTVGQFGEGYKIAALVLNRLGKTFTIYNNEKGEIEVYVNGLFVDCNSDLKYGYNFKPKYIRLERDRKTCDSWNVEEITSLMIAEAMVKGDIPIEQVRKMIEERADDVYHFEFNTYKNDVKKVQEMLIESFDSQNPQPYSIPVDSQEDVKKVKAYGGNPVVVPSGVAKLLKEEKEKRIKTLMEIPCASVMTLKDKFNRWYDIYAEKLPPEAQVEIRNLIEELE